MAITQQVSHITIIIIAYFQVHHVSNDSVGLTSIGYIMPTSVQKN